MAYEVLRQDQVLAVGAPPAQDEVGIRIVGAVVVDRDPLQLRSQLRLGAGHHLAGEGWQVGDQLAAPTSNAFWRQDDAEMALVTRRPVGRAGDAALSPREG